MDLREYEYISKRPDTFPLSTLRSISELLSRAQLQSSIDLINRVIESGYITPPADYPWHGYYQITLTSTEKQAIIDDMACVPKRTNLSDEESHYLRQYIEYFTRCQQEKPLTYTEHQARYPIFDLRDISMEDFENLLFRLKVAENLSEEERIDKYINTWAEGDPAHIAKLYIELFHNSADLLEKYTDEGLENGLWVSMGSGLHGFTAHDLIWRSKLPIETKEELIGSMYFLYRDFYSVKPLEHSCNMWWDGLAFCFFRIDTKSSEHDRRIQQAMFDTLQKILLLDSTACQFAALHGLGHLRHPDTAVPINAYIERNRKRLSRHQLRYAKGCIAGDIM